MPSPFDSISVAKHIKRSPFRRWLGRQFYIAKRWYYLRKRDAKFATPQPETLLPYLIKIHQSLLLRPLKNVDMQLQRNKITNLTLAVEKINRVVIEPGETFSFWKLVGKPTARKGYLTGLVLQDGQAREGIGGGLCQLGNLLYWMALHSPLEVKERYRHGFDVFPDVNRTIPFGCGATLSYNYIDLQLYNPTDQPFQLVFSFSDTHLQGQLRGSVASDLEYQVYESKHLMRGEIWGGYTRHNQIRRKVLNKLTGEEIADEWVTENHAIMMYNPLLEK